LGLSCIATKPFHGYGLLVLSDQERCSGLDAILSSTLDGGKRSLTAKSVDALHNAGIQHPFSREQPLAFAIRVLVFCCIATLQIYYCQDSQFQAEGFHSLLDAIPQQGLVVRRRSNLQMQSFGPNNMGSRILQ